MSFEISNEKDEKDKKSRHSYRYSFNVSLPLCKPAYAIHITKYYHFRFSNLSEDLGKVYCSEKSGGVEAFA